MAAEFPRLQLLNKTRANHSESRHLVLARDIRPWQDWEDGPNNAPDDIKKRGIRARNLMFEENCGLVLRHFSKMHVRIKHQPGYDDHDFCQELNQALLRACERHRPDLGYRLSTLAEWWARAAFSRYLNRIRSSINISAGQLETIKFLKTGRLKPSDLTPNQKQSVVCALQALKMSSLDQPIKNGNTEEFHELVASQMVTADPDVLDMWARIEQAMPVDAKKAWDYCIEGKRLRDIGLTSHTWGKLKERAAAVAA